MRLIRESVFGCNTFSKNINLFCKIMYIIQDYLIKVILIVQDSPLQFFSQTLHWRHTLKAYFAVIIQHVMTIILCKLLCTLWNYVICRLSQLEFGWQVQSDTWFFHSKLFKRKGHECGVNLMLSAVFLPAVLSPSPVRPKYSSTTLICKYTNFFSRLDIFY